MEVAVHIAKQVKLLDVFLMPNPHACSDCIKQREKRNGSFFFECNKRICNPFRRNLSLGGLPGKCKSDGSDAFPWSAQIRQIHRKLREAVQHRRQVQRDFSFLQQVSFRIIDIFVRCVTGFQTRLTCSQVAAVKKA